MATIFESKSVLLLASGTNKAGAVAAVEDDVSESMPTSMLRSHPDAVLFPWRRWLDMGLFSTNAR